MVTLSTSIGSADEFAPQVPVVKTSNAAQVTLVASGAHVGRITGENRLRYPGFEQTTLVHTKGHVVMITMEAVEEENRGPVQCSCSSYALREDGPPVQEVNLKRLTEYQNRGERLCNHPKAAADEKGNIVWLYGSDYQSDRPNTYAGIINEKCEQLSAPQMVNIPNRNSNDGAPDVAYMGNGVFMAGIYSDGNDITGPFPAPGGDYSYAFGLTVDSSGVLPTLVRSTWTTPVVTPTAIGRPTITAVDGNHALFCAAKGPNRPADNVECGLLDSNGTLITKAEFYKGSRGDNGEPRKYFGQPTVVKIAENQFALMAIESNGMGRNANNQSIKGTNLAHMMYIERNGDTLVPGAEIVGAAAHQTHASACTGGYGEQGAPAVGVFSAPPTGVGRAALAMVQFDKATKLFKYDDKTDLWPTSWYGDSGYLSNMYGRNPNRQGRDFLRCIGGIDNPGYGKPNGFMSDVKTFFGAVVHGRIPGDEKNSLFLSLIPGQSDKKLLPQNPVPAGEVVVPEPEAPPPAPAPKSDSGCGCSTPGTNSSGTAGLVALGLGLGLVAARRRRAS
jgi:MYXO-CTERM domain-containing protein